MFMQKLDRLSRMAREHQHKRQCRALLDKPVITPADDGLILFSMIGTAVVLPYLLAIKSLHHHLQRGKIVLLDDGTLTEADKRILAEHLGNPRIIPIASVDTGPCPRGGTWERLLTIQSLREEAYVIQLDSDTVTIGAVPEVAAAIEANLSFTLSGGPIEAPLGSMTLPDFAARFYPNGPEEGGHIQGYFESRILQLPDATNRRYARGCSGFAGFSKGPGRVAAMEAFSQEAEAFCGTRWTEWGTEQITSNYLIANEAGATLLPYNHYMNYWNEAWGAETRFIHFVGAWRHATSAYATATTQAINQL
jgi:hypothetical protein